MGAWDWQDRVIESNWLRTEPTQTGINTGWNARYYADDGSRTINESRFVLGRKETSSNLNWSGIPAPAVPADNFIVRLSSYFVAPTAGSYSFGVSGDDGTRLYVNDVLAVDAWAVGPPINTKRYGGAVSLAAGQSVKLRAEQWDGGGPANLTVYVNGAIPEQAIPANYLTSSFNGVTNGWQMSVDADGNLAYDFAQVNAGSIVFYDASGEKREYKWDNAKASYVPPTNENGRVTRNANNTITLDEADGRVYIFGSDGRLVSATSPTDDLRPAAIKYEYSGMPAD